MTENQKNSFWSRIDKRGADECWPWAGRTAQAESRGVFSLPTGVFIAPRIIWALERGDAGDLAVCHRCDNPNCCNPSHLFLGTRKENCEDRTAKGRTAQGENHYLHKHPELRNGELNPATKLTRHAVLEIRERFYLLRHELAGKYGVTPAYIGALVFGKTWKHI